MNLIAWLSYRTASRGHISSYSIRFPRACSAKVDRRRRVFKPGRFKAMRLRTYAGMSNDIDWTMLRGDKGSGSRMSQELAGWERFWLLVLSFAIR